MKYELAKELKEAGFPPITRWEVENNYRRSLSVSGQETMPPLGALISELPKNGGFCLHEDGKFGWTCTTDYETFDFGMQGVWFVGSTPEEAVARLWLELNKK